MFAKADHWFSHEADAELTAKDLRHRHGFSEVSYYVRRSKFGGMNVPDTKRLTTLEVANTRLKKLWVKAMLEKGVTRKVLGEKWRAYRIAAKWCVG